MGERARVRFPLYSGMQPVLGSFESTLSFQKRKAFDLFFRCLLTRKRTPSPSPSLLASLSAGMNAHVEMLARLHTRTKFSHTKARRESERGGGWEREGGGGGVRVGGVVDERASRRKIKGSRGSAPLTPPPRFIKICLPIPTLILTQSLSAQADRESTTLPLISSFFCISVCFLFTVFSHEIFNFFLFYPHPQTYVTFLFIIIYFFSQ